MTFLVRDDLKTSSEDRSLLGFFVGVVVDNKDPLKLLRVRVRVPEIHRGIPNKSLPWAAQMRPVFLGGATAHGTFSVPKVGTRVVVVFDRGDIYSPIYIGELMSRTTVASPSREKYPNKYGTIDGAGCHDIVDMSEGNRDVEVKRLYKIKCENKKVNADKSVEVKAGQKVTIEADEIVLEASNILIKGGTIKFKKR